MIIITITKNVTICLIASTKFNKNSNNNNKGNKSNNNNNNNNNNNLKGFSSQNQRLTEKV